MNIKKKPLIKIGFLKFRKNYHLLFLLLLSPLTLKILRFKKNYYTFLLIHFELKELCLVLH